MNEILINDLTITQTASSAVKTLMEEKNIKDHALRIFVSGSTCSGIQYGMAFEAQIRPEDKYFETDNLKIVIDEISINYLRGATVDYFEDQTNKGFRITNPNIVSACGCGDKRDNPSSGMSGCGGCS